MSYTRKGRRAVALGAASTLLVGGVLTAASTPASAAAQTGGTLFFITHSEQLDHIDPQRVYTGRDIAFLNTYIYRNLVMYKPVAGAKGASLVPDLATNTGIPSNGAKTWKFTLRPGSTWEDGSAVTCADIKYGVSRTFAQDVITDGPQYAVTFLDIPRDGDSSAYKGPYSKVGQQYYDKAVSCSKDNRTITFKLARAVADFNYALTYPAFSPVKASKDTGEKYDLKPLATGPYKIQKYAIGDELVLVRNNKWKKSSDPVRTPYPDEVRLRFGLAEEVRDQIFLQNSIPNAVNFDGLLPTNLRTFFNDATRANNRLNVFDPYVRYAAFNVKAVPCVEVRQAVFFAINTQALIDLSGGSVYYGEPGDNPVKPVLGVDYTKTKGNIHDPAWSITGNPDKAKSLLAAAATKCPAVYDKATNPAKGLVWDIANSATNQKAATLITEATAKAGLNIKFNFIPPGSYYSTVMNNDKQNDISSAGWGADWANASTVLPELFLKEGGFNLSQNWNDPKYAAFESLMKKALGETNRAKQAALWKQGSQYVMDEYWIIRPVFSKTQFVWNKGVGGVAYWDPQGNFLFPTIYVK